MAIWNGERRQMAAADFRLCGHASSGPSGVFAQSNARTTVAISDEPSQAVLSPNPAEARLFVCATKSVNFYEEMQGITECGLPPIPYRDRTAAAFSSSEILNRRLHAGRGRAHASIGQVKQRRLDPPADVVGIAEVKLGEDRVDVFLNRPLGKHERLGDVRVAEALRHQGQRLELSRGELFERGTRPAHACFHELVDHG